MRYDDPPPTRARAWYYLIVRREAVTFSYRKREGVCLAFGRAAAGRMKKHLIKRGRCPEHGSRLAACGFDGHPELGDLIEARRMAGDRLWFEYSADEASGFVRYPLDPIGMPGKWDR